MTSINWCNAKGVIPDIPYGLHGQWVPCVQCRCRWWLYPQPNGRTGSEPSAALQHLVTRANGKREVCHINWIVLNQNKSKLTPHVTQIICMALFHFVYGAQRGLRPIYEVICVWETRMRIEKKQKTVSRIAKILYMVDPQESWVFIFYSIKFMWNNDMVVWPGELVQRTCRGSSSLATASWMMFSASATVPCSSANCSSRSLCFSCSSWLAYTRARTNTHSTDVNDKRIIPTFRDYVVVFLHLISWNPPVHGHLRGEGTKAHPDIWIIHPIIQIWVMTSPCKCIFLFKSFFIQNCSRAHTL